MPVLFIVAVILLSIGSSRAETINYLYDTMGRLIQVTYGDGTTIEYTYDKMGNRTQKNVYADSMISVTIITLPAALQMTVDGNAFTSPKTFSWPKGTSHTLNVTSSQTGSVGTRYVFSSWSDGGGQSHTITVPESATTYAANFTTQYLLTTTVNPPGSGSVSATPDDCSGGCWYNSGTPISLSPTPSGGNTFSSWTGDINSLNAPLSFLINGTKNITANFNSVIVIGTVRIAGITPVYYPSILDAYSAAINNNVIQAQALSYGEILTFSRTDIPGLSITLKGGYNSSYSDNKGLTIVSSPLTIGKGTTITLDNIVIQ